jgi:hypothetical protein
MKILKCFTDYEVIFIDHTIIKFNYVMEFNRAKHKRDYYAHKN